MSRRHRSHPRSSSHDPHVRGSVYIIVNDLIKDRVKIGYTMQDPVTRARDLVSTGTTGTFVVLYEARVNDPHRVEQDVHRRLTDCRQGGEWFLVNADAAVEIIRSSAHEGIHYEDTTARWHASQPEPSEATKTLLATERAKAEEERRQERARQCEAELARRREAERVRQREAERQQCAAADARRRAEEEQEAQEAKARRYAANQKKLRAQMAVTIPLGLAALVVCGVLFAASMPTPPPTNDDLDRMHREVDRLEADVSQVRGKLQAATDRLLAAESNLQSLPKELAAIHQTARGNDQAVRVAEQRLVSSEKRQAEFTRKWLDFKAAARAQAEQDKKRFVDAKIDEFLAEEDRIVDMGAAPMSDKGIQNNIAQIRRDAEPEAIAVYRESERRAMRKIRDTQAEITQAVNTARQTLTAAQRKRAQDAGRLRSIPEELDRNRQLASELKATLASLEKSLRLADVAYAEAKASLRAAERATHPRLNEAALGATIPARKPSRNFLPPGT